MKWLEYIIGEGKDLSVLQMSVRGIIIFIAASCMLRIAGKRSFGKNSAIDNVIMITLGAILSRAITGSSPFLPVLVSYFVIVLFHRFLAWCCIGNNTCSFLINGEEKSLYKNGAFNIKNMKNCMVSEQEMKEAVRLKINKSGFEEVEQIVMEINGEMSIVEKKG